MNAAIVKFGSVEAPLGEHDRAHLREWADRCAAADIAFLPVVNWWGAHEPEWVRSFEPLVAASGNASRRTPCPFSEPFWRDVITPRLRGILAALDGEPLGALCLDTEMYGAEAPFVSESCYCDRCFRRYLEATGGRGALPTPVRRAQEVHAAGDDVRYRQVQREAARTLAAACLRELDGVREGVHIGVLHLDHPFALQEGLALGFGIGGRPIVCLSEETYSSGFSESIAQARARFRALGAAVDFVSGIFQSRFWASDLAAQLYYCARAGAGYWVYTMQTFADPAYQALAEPAPAYWAAIAAANQELAKADANPSFKTALRLNSTEAPPLSLPWNGFIRYPLADLPAARPAAPSPWLRQASWIYLPARKGDVIRAELALRVIGSYRDSGAAGLVAPGGQRVGSVRFDRDHSGILSVVAGEAGVYGLVVQTGMNAAELTACSRPFAVSIAPADGGAYLVTRIPELFLRMNPGAVHAALELRVPAEAQAVRAHLAAVDGSEVWQGLVSGRVKVELDRLAGEVLRLRIERVPGCVLQDVHVTAVAGLRPFISTAPSATP